MINMGDLPDEIKAKAVVRGRGYSKRAGYERLSLGETISVLNQLWEQAKKLGLAKELPGGQRIMPIGNWEIAVVQAEHIAKGYLGERNLPTDYRLYKWGKNDWQPTKPANPANNFYDFTTLPVYIKELGFECDSFPDLAARMLEACSLIRQSIDRGETEQAVKWGYDLGELRMLWNIYNQIDTGSGKGGKKSKIKQWAQELASELVKNNPGKTPKELWELIPEGEGSYLGKTYAGFGEVYRDKIKNQRGKIVDGLEANSYDHGIDKLSKHSFRRYMPNTK